MFDISFSELMLIGLIALIVIGPERLPKVARTVGHLLGRAQRYVGDVKSDIQREMDLDELDNLKGQMEEAAKSVKSSMETARDSLKEPLKEAEQALGEASASLDSVVENVKARNQDKADDDTAAIAATPDTPATPASSDSPSGRQAESATPVDAAAESAPQPDTDTLPLPGIDRPASPTKSETST
ncbi:Sec-independent protein translocase protein TatB [Allopusillimonas ginsengisoli]|uniref:Sec-independent protein translocase protein TatB n=1 Tax=Allopusillimonas ginsengisoli TaxID=453575 RepID=UPI0010C1DD09|nr:twin-arginine translocase subunit TatB [Allopusillimonas ginsengisoli]